MGVDIGCVALGGGFNSFRPDHVELDCFKRAAILFQLRDVYCLDGAEISKDRPFGPFFESIYKILVEELP